MRKTIDYCLLLLVCFCSFLAKAQRIDYASNKEKVYVQTSHVFFNPGETMFFKLYVVNANTQAPSFLSNAVYAEIIGPAGNVVQKINYGVENGYAEGSFDFSSKAAGGVYKLRAYTTWMRNETEQTFFEKEVTLMKVIAPRLLMKLDFPEKGYGPGDEVKADFSVRNLSDLPVRNYPAAYKVSVNGEAILTNTFHTDAEGKAQLRFNLPNTLNSTDGLLNIAIEYDSYVEAISRSIPIILNKLDLQFMPEGGALVQDITTHVAFRAINEHGKPVDVKGAVLDSKGNKVADFESLRFGMGKFLFTPQKNERYTAAITTPARIAQTFPLPLASVQGIVMNIENAANNQLLVKMNATNSGEVTLTAETKNTKYINQKIKLQAGENKVTVDKNKFPAGIARFTLFAGDGLPVAERLVFLNENKNLQVSISTNKPRYLPRERVTLTITTKDDKGNPVPSNLSLAVLDDKLWTFADDKQDNILSWLLMSSELKGKIEEPNFYFKKDEPKAPAALDLVMLTHGYRYFDYTAMVDEEGKLPFQPDQPYILSGKVLNGTYDPLKATVYLLQDVTKGKAIEYKTAADGVFYFSQLSPNSHYYLFAQATGKNEKVSLLVTQNGMGYNPIRFKDVAQPAYVKDKKQVEIPVAANRATKQGSVQELIQQQSAMGVVDFDFTKVSNLDDVVVVGYGIQRRRDITGSVSTVRAADIGSQNLFLALQGRIPGLEITQNAGNPQDAPKVVIRGINSLANTVGPLYVVDGVPMENFRVNAINQADIESITVLKDANGTAIYGSRAANGAILIETKKQRSAKLRFNFHSKQHYDSKMVRTGEGPAYAAARRFYAPQYFTTEPHERTDFRETIYWNPVIQTDKTGTAQVEFYNSDAATTFRAIAEGIGYNGKAGRAEYTYVTKSALQVDAKIPPYLTVGDRALVPLVIKNNSMLDATVRVKVTLPATVEAADFPNTFQLPADSSRQLLIPVKVLAATDGIIQLVVETDQKTETVKLPITAVEKGFPVIETFSGNKSGKYEFAVSKVVPGSLHTQLKLFKSLEGQLLDGIESMLREPYGCFEQTSSCTYPNIYILKYLKESGKSNAEIEKKALGYITAGYTRLVGFETKVNGFEWFGHTPPNEALTAYGLMEFTDMEEFIKVDKQMLDRTKQFLLSRRDGKGGFNIQAYNHFASVPNKIADVYIVYAMTQAGIGNEIVPEYEAAVKQAIESKDGYQMAMMALAASNMKRAADYRILMNALHTGYQKNGLASETSVVLSREASLRVETAALYAMALMRDQSSDIGTIAQLITHILGDKSYYGYGSTQATVLALKAIVEYSKLTGKISENPMITFTMNKNITNTDNTLTAAVVKEGKNVFDVQYDKQSSAIPYSLQVWYNTLTPPNSEKAELTLTTRLAAAQTRIGETMRMDIDVTNIKSQLQPMAIAKIGIPAGLSVQPWQLKELQEKGQMAYYEIFDNYLVLYWLGFAASETKTIKLDLKADVAGTYKGKASNTYLYYTPEYKNWTDGVEITIAGE